MDPLFPWLQYNCTVFVFFLLPFLATPEIPELSLHGLWTLASSRLSSTLPSSFELCRSLTVSRFIPPAQASPLNPIPLSDCYLTSALGSRIGSQTSYVRLLVFPSEIFKTSVFLSAGYMVVLLTMLFETKPRVQLFCHLLVGSCYLRSHKVWCGHGAWNPPTSLHLCCPPPIRSKPASVLACPVLRTTFSPPILVPYPSIRFIHNSQSDILFNF